MQDKPKVITWYQVYLGVMIFFSLLTIGFGIFCAVMPAEWKAELTAEDAMVLEIYKYLMPVFGVIGLVMYVLPFILRPSKGRWIYDIVLIALGMGSCMLVASIPLIIFYVKPETEAYFESKTT